MIRRSKTLPAATARSHLAAPIMLFVIFLAVPVVLQVGSLRLSPYRIILLAMVVPCIWGWMTGMAGRVRISDLLVLAIAIWSAASFLVVHGPLSGIEAAGIVFIETLVPYLLARCYIQSLEAFCAFVRLLSWIVLALLPFAIAEALTSWNGPIRLADVVFQTHPDVAKPVRWGLDRVQGPFEHPILFGVFAGAALALAFYTLQKSRLIVSGGVMIAAVLSLSSGPLAAVAAQGGMIFWDRIFRHLAKRWHLLGVIALLAYVLVDLCSNRTPAEVFISYAAFNPDTAYNRLLIWEWGWANIWQNPWFGLGNNDWERLWFMTASVDMFWVQRAMVHGLPVGLLNQMLFFAVLLGLVRCRSRNALVLRCRTGLAICLIGFYVAGMTVHFWNATFVLLMFLFGSAAWFNTMAQVGTKQTSNRFANTVGSTPVGILSMR